MGRVFVIGNAGFDLRIELPRLPREGETLLSHNMFRALGGKGLNQATVASRSGAQVHFTAPIGSDAEASQIERLLDRERFAALKLHRLPNPSDFSLLMVLPGGENSIVSSGACAAALSAEDVATAASRATPGDVVVLQGNLSAEATEAALATAASRGAIGLFNPAPLWWDVRPALAASAIVVANRREAEDMTGRPDPCEAADILRDLGASQVIVTLGDKGCLSLDGNGPRHHAASRVEALDTTGCGDTFCGILAACIAGGQAVADAIEFAQRAAAITASRRGAFSALPSRDELAAIHAVPVGDA